MSTDAAIKAALDGILPLYPNLYTGDELRYIVYNYSTIPDVFGDSVPHAARYFVQVHLYLPSKENPNQYKLTISRALNANGFTWPSITNASDGDGQHYTFECNYVNGGGFYGET